jgi:hypothetical protein
MKQGALMKTIGTLRSAAVAALWALAAFHGVPAVAADDDPKQYVQFVEEFAGNCVTRQGVQILVKSTHPSRKLRVWLDRYHMGKPTADRSRTDLAPGAEPEPLGCSTNANSPQDWRVVRATFID